MKKSKIAKYVPKYSIIEKEITENAILNDLINDNKIAQISFSYKTETLIQFMYYCLTYFFKNKTYGESFHNIELFENNKESYLFKLKLILPNLLKLILKYLSIYNSWFNFTFQGIELINLIICFESPNNVSNSYSSLLNYLLNLKYRLGDEKRNNIIFYSTWFDVFINKISDIIAEIYSSNLILFKSPKEKLFELIGFNNKKDRQLCQICKQFPTNSISFQCGHFFCYYCYFYNFMSIYPEKNITNNCFLCNSG